MPAGRVRILAISGSLRAASSNSAILRAAASVAPAHVDVRIFGGIDGLPYFNPDLDRTLDDPALPAAVRDFRAEVGASDALLISTPEYAHGVPGVLKNALDWLVGGSEMPEKPIAVLNLSPFSTHAHASLVETLRTMSARLVDDAALPKAVLKRWPDESAMLADSELCDALRVTIARLQPDHASS